MSGRPGELRNRTFESNRAIVLAWRREKGLIQEGKCTRDWSEEEQNDILTTGKAHDSEGRAYIGQHMRSAEKHPEDQGNPDNIQFLTFEEHLEAHDGCFRNPTNWYYDPVTRKKTDFGDGPVIPCKVIKLSHPVVKIEAESRLKEDKAPKETREEKASKSSGNDPPNKAVKKQTPLPKEEPEEETVTFGEVIGILKDAAVEKAKKTAKEIKKTVEVAAKFYKNNKEIIDPAVKGITVAFISTGAAMLKQEIEGDDSIPGYDYGICQTPSAPEEKAVSGIIDEVTDPGTESKRGPVREHTVGEHSQRYGKNKVWIQKKPYPRGGNKKG